MKLILILVRLMNLRLFRIDVYFTEYCLAVEIDEKGHTDRDPIFEQKRQKALEKKLNCTFIRFNTSKENFDVDYETSKIQSLISQFKNNKIKEIDNKNKELEDKNKELEDKKKELKDEIKKLKLQLANVSVNNNNDNDKK